MAKIANLRPKIGQMPLLSLLMKVVQAYHFGKNDFELGVGEEGQDTSQNFEGSFGSIRATLPM